MPQNTEGEQMIDVNNECTPLRIPLASEQAREQVTNYHFLVQQLLPQVRVVLKPDGDFC